MSKLNITKGEWVSKDNPSSTTKTTEIFTNTVERVSITTPVFRIRHNEESLREAKANAQLIADAGTTANKCGLLPSELLLKLQESETQVKKLLSVVEMLSKEVEGIQNVQDQRDELLEALSIAIKRQGFTNEELINTRKLIKSC